MKDLKSMLKGLNCMVFLPKFCPLFLLRASVLAT